GAGGRRRLGAGSMAEHEIDVPQRTVGWPAAAAHCRRDPHPSTKFAAAVATGHLRGSPPEPALLRRLALGPLPRRTDRACDLRPLEAGHQSDFRKSSSLARSASLRAL